MVFPWQQRRQLQCVADDTCTHMAAQPLWLLSRASRSQQDQLDAMSAVMDATVEEWATKRLAEAQGLAGADPGSSSEPEGQPQHQEREPDLRHGLASGYAVRKVLADAVEDESGGPNNSPWGRRALGDDWYESRCVRCSVCHGDISASVRRKRGVRCRGCLRWFHDGCAPPGTLPEDKSARECDAPTSKYFHSQACRDLHHRLHTGALSRCGPVQGGVQGCSVTFIDLHSLRQQLNTKDDRGQESADKDSIKTARGPSTGQTPFERIAQADLRLMKRHGTRHVPHMRDMLSDIAGVRDLSDPASDPSTAAAPRQLGGVRDLQVVARIFDQSKHHETLDEVLEDSWAAYLQCGGTPVTAATLIVLGGDHARLQALNTVPDARRRGHARALLSSVQGWLREAGVPRLVAVLPARRPQHGRDEDGGEGALKRMGFRSLQDLDMLGMWKEVWYPYYTKELIGRAPRVLSTVPSSTRSTP